MMIVKLSSPLPNYPEGPDLVDMLRACIDEECGAPLLYNSMVVRALIQNMETWVQRPHHPIWIPSDVSHSLRHDPMSLKSTAMLKVITMQVG